MKKHTAMEGVEQQHSGIPALLARPQALFLGALIAGHGLDHLLPMPLVIAGDHLLRHAVGGALMGLGLAAFIAGIRNVSRNGIYAWSRNPIYVGLFAFYAGAAVLLRSPWAFLFLLPIMVLMRRVVTHEEAYLEQRFGGAYREYKDRVPRWL